MVERLIEEARRREKVIRIFPNERSAWRLLGALLAEQHEVWSTSIRWLDLDAYGEWKAAQELRQASTTSGTRVTQNPDLIGDGPRLELGFEHPVAARLTELAAQLAAGRHSTGKVFSKQEISDLAQPPAATEV